MRASLPERSANYYSRDCFGRRNPRRQLINNGILKGQCCLKVNSHSTNEDTSICVFEWRWYSVHRGLIRIKPPRRLNIRWDEQWKVELIRREESWSLTFGPSGQTSVEILQITATLIKKGMWLFTRYTYSSLDSQFQMHVIININRKLYISSLAPNCTYKPNLLSPLVLYIRVICQEQVLDD